MKKLKKIPTFKNEDEEAKFWNRVDSTEYIDWSKAEHWSFPNLKLTSRPITLRDRSDGAAISSLYEIAEPVPNCHERLLRFARNDSEGSSPRNDNLNALSLRKSWYYLQS